MRGVGVLFMVEDFFVFVGLEVFEQEPAFHLLEVVVDDWLAGLESVRVGKGPAGLCVLLLFTSKPQEVLVLLLFEDLLEPAMQFGIKGYPLSPELLIEELRHYYINHPLIRLILLPVLLQLNFSLVGIQFLDLFTVQHSWDILLHMGRELLALAQGLQEGVSAAEGVLVVLGQQEPGLHRVNA